MITASVIKVLSDSNGTWIHNYLVCKRTLNHLVSLAKWLSVRLLRNWLWLRVPLLSLNLMYWIGSAGSSKDLCKFKVSVQGVTSFFVVARFIPVRDNWSWFLLFLCIHLKFVAVPLMSYEDRFVRWIKTVTWHESSMAKPNNLMTRWI